MNAVSRGGKFLTANVGSKFLTSGHPRLHHAPPVERFAVIIP